MRARAESRSGRGPTPTISQSRAMYFPARVDAEGWRPALGMSLGV